MESASLTRHSCSSRKRGTCRVSTVGDRFGGIGGAGDGCLSPLVPSIKVPTLMLGLHPASRHGRGVRSLSISTLSDAMCPEALGKGRRRCPADERFPVRQRPETITRTRGLASMFRTYPA